MSKLEIVSNQGHITREVLSNYDGVGSNKAVDIYGNKYEFDSLLNRWERKLEE